jgi:hypothetical protein
MDWEHPFYASNSANTRPPKAFYIDLLQNGMGEFSPIDVEQCIAAYHAAEDDNHVGGQHVEYDGSSPSYPNIGGSSWYINQDDDTQQYYDVPFHHTSSTSHNLIPRTALNDSIPPTTDDQFTCRGCKKSFLFRNKLHLHLKDTKHFAAEPPVPVFRTYVPICRPIPNDSAALGTGYAFRGYNFAEIAILASPTQPPEFVSADSGCRMSCVDETWFKENYPDSHVASMNIPIKVRGIGSTVYPSRQYSVAKIYIPAKKEGLDILVELLGEFHFVQGLGCHMLLGNDIMVPNGIILDLAEKKLKIPSCGASAEIRIRNRQTPVINRKV